ncbi:MAG: N-acetylglucosamine kinase [Myxococcota bacterium]
MKSAVIGLDAGGTKTDAALALPSGEVVARARGGPANWQSAGREGAGRVYGALLRELSAEAEDRGLRVDAVGYGLAGLDRPRDEEVLGEIVSRVQPFDARRTLVNDTFCILRAGSEDGAGVAAVSGTGCNVVGIGRDGRPTRVGGIGWEFGDWGGGPDIGHAGVAAAFRGADGRGEPTRLTAMLKERFGLERLDDLIDLYVADAGGDVDAQASVVAVLMFDAAAEGDAVARRILEQAGGELALSARIVAGRLFGPDDAFALVMGGSVFQKGRVDVMRDAFVDGVRRDFPRAQPVVLRSPPIVGAVLLGLDRLAETRPEALGGPWPDPSVHARLEAQMKEDA